MTRARGTFDVKTTPLAMHDTVDPTLGRRSLDKVLHGDLEATGHGEMLTATTAVEGSAGGLRRDRADHWHAPRPRRLVRVATPRDDDPERG